MNVIFRLLVVAVVAGLGGCASYRPLYGTNNGGENVAASLGQISVLEQRSRAGQLVRNEILTSTNTDSEPRFELRFTPTETKSSISSLAGTNTKRMRYHLSVVYELRNLQSGAVINQGTSFSNVPYDTVREPVADLQAANNAQARAAVEVGQDLRLRLAAFLSAQQGK